MTTEIPQCDMIIIFVQSDKHNPKGLLKNKIAQCEPGLRWGTLFVFDFMLTLKKYYDKLIAPETWKAAQKSMDVSLLLSEQPSWPRKPKGVGRKCRGKSAAFFLCLSISSSYSQSFPCILRIS